jgi:hypothetical protein
MNNVLSAGHEEWLWRGDQNADVLACGESHRYAMLAAIGERLLGPDVRAAVLSQSTAGHREVDDSYWNKVIASIDGRPLAVLWGGNRHNRFILKPSQGFRLAYGCGAFECEGDPFVPVEAVRALMLPFVSGLDSFLGRATGRARVFVVGSPPPKQERMVRNGFIKEPGYANIARQRGLDIATAPISPLSVRKSLWCIYQDLFAESASRNGAIFVPVPDYAMDPGGSLREELCASDATHGNAAYGAVMWKEIFAAVKRAKE